MVQTIVQILSWKFFKAYFWNYFIFEIISFLDSFWIEVKKLRKPICRFKTLIIMHNYLTSRENCNTSEPTEVITEKIRSFPPDKLAATVTFCKHFFLFFSRDFVASLQHFLSLSPFLSTFSLSNSHLTDVQICDQNCA